MIALLKWWKNDSIKVIDNSSELKRFRLLLVEFRTRKVGKRFNETNILEYMNSLFSLVQSLRDFLKTGEYDWKDDTGSTPSTINNITLTLCNDILNFQDKWNLSYTTWWNSFKHSSFYKKEIVKGRPFIFYDLQNYFDGISSLVEDIDILNGCIDNYIKAISKIYVHLNSGDTVDSIKLNIQFVS